jgi:hypothetical protein
MHTSYKESDVVLLLKDLTGQIEAEDTEVRERMIQSGVHYSEMLPREYVPTKRYIDVYQKALREFSASTAKVVALLSTLILQQKGESVVLVSLARAGISAGVLIKH